VRIVPGGSSIRDGCYIGKGVTCMPPMYINAGAYVDDGTMVDSHALVGSCAQVGKNCHISAASQIGGVLEPVGAMPVIVEDEVLVGGNCGVYEGTVVKKRAVLGTGTILNRSTPVYDLVRHTVHRADRRRAAGHPRRGRDRRRLARHHQRPRQGLGHFGLHAGDREVPRPRRKSCPTAPTLRRIRTGTSSSAPPTTPRRR
jgi:tetrahydrodipicolinate N-succinyltransferase